MARDSLYYRAREALEKEGWTITHDPLSIPFGGTFADIDLGAAKLIAAEKGERKIPVEVKSFLRNSMLYDFHTALGQFINYREALKESDPDRELFLAVPEDAYRVFFVEDIVARVLAANAVCLIVFNPDKKKIVEWRS